MVGFVRADRAAAAGCVPLAAAVVAAVVPAPMAGLQSRNGDENGQTGEKPSPVTALGRADTAAGWRRGGKPREQPPAAGRPPQADVVAVQRVSKGGAGFRCGQSCQRRQLRGRTGRRGGMSGPVAARGGVART